MIDDYVAREVIPHVPDAWVDYETTKVGYEIPINPHFYVYRPPRPLHEIEAEITRLEGGVPVLPAAVCLVPHRRGHGHGNRRQPGPNFQQIAIVEALACWRLSTWAWISGAARSAGVTQTS